MASSGREDREEQFLLRVQDPALAERLRNVLRETAPSEDMNKAIELIFKDSDRQGEFVFGEERYTVLLKDLPCIVESYKTFDDINLVKSSDVGQMLLVQPKGAPVDPSPEARDGVTPAMRDVRNRLFRPKIESDPAHVARVERDLLTILGGAAPPGVEYMDVEEEYVVDEAGVGKWLPCKRR